MTLQFPQKVEQGKRGGLPYYHPTKKSTKGRKRLFDGVQAEKLARARSKYEYMLYVLYRSANS